jgi:hypothetical protein
MGLDKCVMACVPFYSILQTSVTAITLLCSTKPISAPFPEPQADTDGLPLPWLVFSRTSCGYNHTARRQPASFQTTRHGV